MYATCKMTCRIHISGFDRNTMRLLIGMLFHSFLSLLKDVVDLLLVGLFA